MNKINRLSKISLILILLLTLAGCAIPNPTKPGDTLLIGQMNLEAQNWFFYGEGNINKTQVANIFIYFQNCDTRHSLMVSTNRYGLFSLVNPNPGTYIMKEFSCEAVGDDGSWETLQWKPQMALTKIQINPGQVINLGSLHWIANKADKVYKIVQDSDSPDTFRKIFTEKFPNSPWLQREWVNTVIQTPDNENSPDLIYGTHPEEYPQR